MFHTFKTPFLTPKNAAVPKPILNGKLRFQNDSDSHSAITRSSSGEKR